MPTMRLREWARYFSYLPIFRAIKPAPPRPLTHSLPAYPRRLYVEPMKRSNLRYKLDSLYSFEKFVRKYLSKSHYREDVEDAIGRYTRVLDSREWNFAFV